MKLVPETTDLGAPEYFVSGIADIAQVAPGTIRVSFYTTREDGNFIVCHQVWPAETWADSINGGGRM
jgi:hypothetical protein